MRPATEQEQRQLLEHAAERRVVAHELAMGAERLQPDVLVVGLLLDAEQRHDAVAEELNKQQIYIHLDNHISKGMWCCGSTDGNSWWGDTYFSTSNWVRGLSYMAEHVCVSHHYPFLLFIVSE